ncbi:MAG: class I SAM-dependent methyltransferase [Chloroflexota bacterium]|nr:class I SAM-dependent methyltransferase [Chloroflexota bacterium]
MQSVFDAWRDQVLAHEHDAAALRGGEHGHGHGGFTYANRPLDIRRADDPVLNVLYAAVGADAHVLDVGGGAGRFALPLATRAKRVTVVEPSADSVGLLQSRAAEAGLTNIDVINAPWEEADAPSADVALCSLVLHHVSAAAPFVAKMQAHAKQRVLIVEMMELPGALEVPFYERVYGAAPAPLPALPDALRLLWAMDIFPDLTMLPAEPPALVEEPDSALDYLRRRLSVDPDSEADERLRAAMDDLLVDTPDGLIVRGMSPRRQAILTWRPGG